VLLDPGHGGDDAGAPGPGRVTEKKLNLDIAKRVRDRLADTGLRVLMTRDRDRTADLADRQRRAAQWNADLFVSIHLNSSADRNVHGTETYVVPAAGFPSTAQADAARKSEAAGVPGNQFNAANLVLAYYLQKGLLTCTQSEDRGIKRARFYVIRNAPCPAALVECGFLSHREEGARLLNDAYRDRVAEGIARGIMTYVSRAREAAVLNRQVTAAETAAPAPAAEYNAP
jgi:N-acetylmuramoyl-L-alanine amidase